MNHDNSSALNRKLGASLSMLNMVASVALGLVYTPFVLHFLGQNEYGVFTLANSLISYLAILDLGFGNTLIRYSARARAQGKDEKNIYGMFLLFYSIISLVALTVGVFLYRHIGSFFATSFSGTEVAILRKIYLILLLNTVISFPASVFSSIIRSHEKFVFANGVVLIQNISRHILNLLVLYCGFHSVALAVLSLLFTIAAALVNMWFCFLKLKIKIGFQRFSKVFYREVFVFSFFILLNVLVDQLYASTDNVILGKVCGSTAVAVYGIGVIFESYFVQFSSSIAGVFLPHISQLSVQENGDKKISDLFLKVGRIQLMILTFILIGYLVFGRQFIRLWAGPGYEDSYYIALAIMIPDLVPLSQNIGISVLQANNQHGVRSVMYLVIAILNVLISIPLAMQFSGFGAALGTAIGNLLGQILFMNWYYWKKANLDIPAYWKQLLEILLKSIPVYVLFFAVDHFVPYSGWGGLFAKGILSVVIAVPYYYALILKSEEKNLLCSLLKRK